MASVVVAAELPLAEVNSSKGEMTVHCSGGDEVYTMTKIPRATASLVEAEKKDILKGLGLKSLLTNLNRASDLLFLAYMAAWGTGDLHVSIAKRQTELLRLCGECVVTIDALQKASTRVQNELLEAYLYLLEADETEAMEGLARCAQHASTMSDKCQKLAVGFGALKEETVKDKLTAIKKLGEQIVKIEDLEKEKHDLEAKRKKEEALENVTTQSIHDLEQRIAKEEAKEEVAAGREFALQIVGALAAAAGAALGGYVKMRTFNLMPAPSEEPEAAKPQGPSFAELQDSRDAISKAKKDLEEAEAEEEKATAAKEAVDGKVFEADVDKTKKKTALEGAKSDEAVKQAQKALDASAAKLEKLQEEKTKVEESLKKTEKKKKLALEASESAAEAFKSLSDSAKEMAQGQRDRLKELAITRMNLVEQKIERENQHRESLGKLAFLTSSLNSNAEVFKVGEEAKNALAIAEWALTNIEVSLFNAKFFWDSMQRFCEDLATPEALQKIQNLVKKGKTDEERIKFYKSQHFVPIAVTYICKWTALISVCGDYVEASSEAMKSVEGHMRQSPNREEAKNLIGPLQTRLRNEYLAETIEIDNTTEALSTQRKQLESDAGIVADA